MTLVWSFWASLQQYGLTYLPIEAQGNLKNLVIVMDLQEGYIQQWMSVD